MKRSLFAFSLIALLFAGFSTVQAQGAVAPSTKPMTPFEAYKANFTKAINEGNVGMADPHRQKLVSFMGHDIQIVDGTSNIVSAQPTAPKKATKQEEAAAKVAAADLTRQKEILEIFKSMDLSNASALEAAKSKLALIDEYGQLSAKRKPASN